MGKQQDISPLPEETIGQYLRRLREMAGMSQADVIRATEHFSPPRRITSWLARVEAGDFEYPDAEKLSVLAQLYGERSGVTIPVDLLRVKAGYDPLFPPDTRPDWLVALEARPALRELARKIAELPEADFTAIETMVNHLWSRLRGDDRLYGDRARSDAALEELEDSGLRPKRKP
jgi:transcriptional regulator with XRE-family HTH domain